MSSAQQKFEASDSSDTAALLKADPSVLHTLKLQAWTENRKGARLLRCSGHTHSGQNLQFSNLELKIATLSPAGSNQAVLRMHLSQICHRSDKQRFCFSSNEIYDCETFISFWYHRQTSSLQVLVQMDDRKTLIWHVQNKTRKCNTGRSLTLKAAFEPESCTV